MASIKDAIAGIVVVGGFWVLMYFFLQYTNTMGFLPLGTIICVVWFLDGLFGITKLGNNKSVIKKTQKHKKTRC